MSKNFTLEELTQSATAVRLGLDNRPSDAQLANLARLATEVLQPLRDVWKQPIVISSGFRCLALNEAVGGVANSQHLVGEAVDIRTLNGVPADNRALFATAVCLVRDGIIEVGQLIDECEYSWIHISLPNRKCHNQVLHCQ